MRPISISPWQLAQTSTHFAASARYLAMDLPLLTLMRGLWQSAPTRTHVPIPPGRKGQEKVPPVGLQPTSFRLKGERS